jgi:hypothetical protein
LCKGCKLYAILALNEKGVAQGLEHLPVVKEFADVFPEELPRMPPKRELEFTIDLKPGTEPIARTALSDVDPGVARVENATEGVAGPGTDTS